MVVGDYAKYVRYDLVPERIQEQLLDLKKYPGETRHFTHEPGSADLLKDLRRQFDEVWFPKQ